MFIKKKKEKYQTETKNKKSSVVIQLLTIRILKHAFWRESNAQRIDCVHTIKKENNFFNFSANW